MSTPALEFDGVTKSYPLPRGLQGLLRHPFTRRTKEALRGLSFRVEPGELLTIMGPTGAGKTTLLKIVTTLILPDRGEVRVWGMPVAQREWEVKRRVGFVVSDERSFYWRLTGRDNLLFFAAMHGLYGAEREKKVERALERVDLTEVKDERFTGYSSGMRQKLAIARGLLHDPELLIMDEPTRSLDPTDQVRLADFVTGRLVGELGRTVVMATHDLTLVERVGRRVLLLHKGRIRASGTREEMTETLGVRPAVTVDLAGTGEETLSGLASAVAVRHLGGASWRITLRPDTTPESLLAELLDRGVAPRSYRYEPVEWGRIMTAVIEGEVEA